MDRRSTIGIVMSGLGVIAAGIVVNNNIVLIDTFNEYRKRGYGAGHAAFRSGLVRFRPVILTAITTILGLIPMVFEMTILLVERQILFGAPSSQWWTNSPAQLLVVLLCDYFDVAGNACHACAGIICGNKIAWPDCCCLRSSTPSERLI